MTLEELKRSLVEQMAREQGRPVPSPGDCPTCGAKPPFEFKDDLSRKEHRISGMCQSCQDSTFDLEED